MRHIWTPPSESDERAPVCHRPGPSVGYRKEAVGHTDARSPPAAAATPTAALCSSRAASHTRTFGSRIGTFTSGWRRPTGCSYDRVWYRSESCGLGVRVGVACPCQPRPLLRLQRVFRVARPPPPTVSDARSAPQLRALRRTALALPLPSLWSARTGTNGLHPFWRWRRTEMAPRISRCPALLDATRLECVRVCCGPLPPVGSRSSST